jgi:branched-chain amino acid transport system ATP-binding protein
MGLAIVPQGRRLWPALTVEENIQLAASQAEDPYSFEKIADFFPVLGEMRSKKAMNMSGGEQQMLAVGRALVGNPDVILMDEPTEGLAPYIVRTLEEAIEEINGEENVTILLVEQQIHTALAVSDHHYILDQGRIVREVSSTELREDEKLRQRFLGV